MCSNLEYNKKGVLEIFIIHAPSSLIKDPTKNMMQMGVNYSRGKRSATMEYLQYILTYLNASYFLSSFINLPFCHFPNAMCSNWNTIKRVYWKSLSYMRHLPSLKTPLAT